MNFVKNLNLLGVEGKEIPCITGEGAPTETTEGTVGCFYMDTDTELVYKCVSVEDKKYIWKLSEIIIDQAYNPESENAQSGKAVAEAVATVGNKISYVTPEMFGAIGDGVTDDTTAIQSALDTGKTVLFTKRYVTSNTLFINKPNQRIIVEGEIISSANPSIYVNQTKTIIEGNGLIRSNHSGTCIKIVTENHLEDVIISVDMYGIDVEADTGSGIGIEITNANTIGSLFPLYITSEITAFNKGVYSHATYDVGAWVSAIEFTGSISHCTQAIVLEWFSEGSHIRGNFQPILNGNSPHNVNKPLIKLSQNTVFDGTIWDFGKAVNNMAIECTGRYNTILNCMHLDGYIKTVSSLNNITGTRQNFEFPAYSNFNVSRVNEAHNLLLNAHLNSEMTVTEKFTNAYIEVRNDFSYFNLGMYSHVPQSTLIRRTDTNAEGIATITYDFNTPKKIRFINVTGFRMPDAIKISLYNNDELIDSITGTQGTDYYIEGGLLQQYSWLHSYDKHGGEMVANKIVIEFTLTTMEFSSIYNIFAADGNTVFLSENGGNITGKVTTIAPTEENQIVNKKYVDDLIAQLKTSNNLT